MVACLGEFEELLSLGILVTSGKIATARNQEGRAGADTTLGALNALPFVKVSYSLLLPVVGLFPT
jgi:hypothetical protein